MLLEKDRPIDFDDQTIAHIKSRNSLYGVIGHPVKHSLSPYMQQAAFNAFSISADYFRIEIRPDKLMETVGLMKQAGFSGWNCTLPHKVALYDLMERTSECAQVLGAVNTVLVEQGQLIGFNTDGQGWVQAILEDFFVEVKDLRIMILGAGGAGQAIAMQAALEGCERLVIANRTLDKAIRLKQMVDPHFKRGGFFKKNNRVKCISMDEKLLNRELDSIDLLVNCTSLGLKKGDPSPLPSGVLKPHLCVYDTIYRPAETALLKAAKQAGARTSNGLSMLLHQGAMSFEIWTARKAPIEAMRSALRKVSSESE